MHMHTAYVIFSKISQTIKPSCAMAPMSCRDPSSSKAISMRPTALALQRSMLYIRTPCTQSHS